MYFSKDFTISLFLCLASCHAQIITKGPHLRLQRDGVPAGPAPTAAPVVYKATTVVSGSSYTLTYTPSQIKSQTNIVESNPTATTTQAFAPGSWVWVAAAPLVAVPFVVPKFPPLPGPNEPPIPTAPPGEPQAPQTSIPSCETKTAKLCKEDCVLEYFGENHTLKSTASCSVTCTATTTACSVADFTTTTTITPPMETPIITEDKDWNIDNPADSGPLSSDDVKRFAEAFPQSNVKAFEKSLGIDEETFEPYGTCSDTKSDINYTTFLALAKVFCDSVDDTTKSFKKTLTNADLPALRLGRRTPPPNPNSYAGYDFDFSYQPSGKECFSDCRTAAQYATDQCGHNGDQTNSMQDGGLVEIGCGILSWSIVPPPPPPSVTVPLERPEGPNHCYNKTQDTENCWYGDVDPKDVWNHVGSFCDKNAGQMIDRVRNSNVSQTGQWVTTGHGVWLNEYNYYVAWASDCGHEDTTSVNLGQPVPDYSCKNAMWEAFSRCTNGGRGGVMQVGCVQYAFNALNQPLQFSSGGPSACHVAPFST